MKLLFLTVLFFLLSCRATTLREMYANAQPGEGYDKLILLETGKIYTGGLEIDGDDGDRDDDIFIKGNGAILDMGSEERLFFANLRSRFDIENLILINGHIRYYGVSEAPLGRVKNVTFYKPIGYGVRLEYCGSDIELARNIVHSVTDEDSEGMFKPTGISFGLDRNEDFSNIRDNWSFNSPNGDYVEL